MIAFTTGHVTVHQGDVREVLRQLPAESIDCCVTSPPYWGLRDYGVAGQLGLEPTPAEYVAKMVEVFREVRRVLSGRGTLWLNLGDSYATGAGKVGNRPGGGVQGDAWGGHRGSRGGSAKQPHTGSAIGPMTQPNRLPLPGLKPKDLMGIPWRVALALQADGWYLRSDIIWAKPNPMPESVTDRPTKAHEYVFLLSKRERYYYDAAAIRTEAKSETTKMPDGWDTGPGGHGTIHRLGREKGRKTDKQRGNSRRHDGFNDRWDQMEKSGQQANGANARTVWTIATHPYPEAHFATFPRELPERCIKAGCPEQVCATCGRPRERITAVGYDAKGRTTNGPRSTERKHIEYGSPGFDQRLEKRVTTIGWTDCGHGDYRPGTVLDPFAGSGTTLAVARDLGRKSIGIELSSEYVKLIERRCAQEALDFTT